MTTSNAGPPLDLLADIERRITQGDPLAAAVSSTRMAMTITDARQKTFPIVYANEGFSALTGYSQSEIVGRNCRFLQGVETDRNEVKKIREAIANENTADVILLNYRKNGSTFWNALRISPVHNEQGELIYYFGGQSDATLEVAEQRIISQNEAILEREVAKRTAELADALKRQEMLVHEVDHRVKNNLAMVGALIRMHSRNIEDEKFKSLLESLQARIHSMAMVHQELQNPVSGELFDASRFIDRLTREIIDNAGRNDIIVRTELQSAILPHKFAAPLGLILNEVVTNAIQHAFVDRSGKFFIGSSENNKTVQLVLTDDGPGKDIHAPRGKSLGSELLERLTAQMRSTIKWDSSSKGTTVTIEIPR